MDKGTGEKRGCFFDPWGTQYNIVVDTNYDNQVEVSTWYSDIPKDESPRSGVAAFALGRDNKLGNDGNKKSLDKNSDDIVSWK